MYGVGHKTDFLGYVVYDAHIQAFQLLFLPTQEPNPDNNALEVF